MTNKKSNKINDTIRLVNRREIIQEKLEHILYTAAAFIFSSLAGSGSVFIYIIITQGPRLNETAGNIAAGLVAVLAMGAVSLVGIYSAIVLVKGGK
jgi:NADH:ubiquinone oxidoreductase subunit H